MTLQLIDESDSSLGIDCQAIAEQVIDAALDYEECPYEVEINLILTTNEEIQKINKEQRNIDRPTDVLSFPMVTYAYPSDFTIIESYEMDCFNPETGELLLGDIVISVDKVKEQAEKYGHSIKREFAFLIAHSMLHLFGYDHEEEVEMAIMEEKQNFILNNLNITR